MAYTYLGDAILGVSLTVETPKPLDTRTVVDNTKDLYSVPASQAYRGMTISNLEDGNIYMLIDKNKITTSDGWKSSQSALQIITCTQEEYNKWAVNTDENYNPIDENENYLLQSVYYYIYEDLELGQYYLSSDWGKNIEDLLSKKASADAVNGLTNKLNEDIENLKNNYTTTETLLVTYATIASIEEKFDTSNPDSYISKLLLNYYTSQQIDDKFVTKESLGGNLDELGGDNYVFVTSSLYAEDLKAIQEELNKTLKLDGEGSLESITVGLLKSPVENDQQLVVEIKPEGIFIGDDPIATESDIPVIIPLTMAEYEQKVADGDINPEAYYCLYDEENNKLVYITLLDLELSYSTTTLTLTWIGLNFYNIKQVDDIVTNLQTKGDYVTSEQIKDYYTASEVDEKFLTIEEATNNYTTKTEVTDLETKISEEYVTITMLKGENTEDTDFMFVTQNQYSDDKEALALSFESKEISSLKSTTSEIIILEIEEKEVELEGDTEGEQITETEVNIISSASLTVKDGNLLKGDKQIALVDDIPTIEPISQAAYNELKEAGETDPNVYYFIEENEENQKDGYITYDYANSTFSTKSEVSQSIGNTKTELEQKIASLEEEIKYLKELFSSTINGSILLLGLKDTINNKTLMVNSGKIENQTLIFT